jgi:hypothetical protein
MAASCHVYDASLIAGDSAAGSTAGGNSGSAGTSTADGGSVLVPEAGAGTPATGGTDTGGSTDILDAGAGGVAVGAAGEGNSAGTRGATGGNAGTGGHAGAAGSGGSGGSGAGAMGGGGAGGSGIAGSGGAGGSGIAGSGGTSPLCAHVSIGSGTVGLIDDLNDGNAFINLIDGRSGAWTFSTDGTGTTVPAPGPATPTATGETGLAQRVQGTGLTGIGASLFVTLVPSGDCYDASLYSGVNVALKGSGQIRLSVLTAAVNAQPAAKQDQYQTVVTLTDVWQDLSFAWTNLHQAGFPGATPIAFDTSKITGVQLIPQSTTQPLSFDFSLDNLAFRKKAAN